MGDSLLVPLDTGYLFCAKCNLIVKQSGNERDSGREKGQEFSLGQNGGGQGSTQTYAASQMATRGQEWPHQKGNIK